jgi:L-ascorbate metabolism protein UlaG (beta-lactamase superfamily)
MIERLHWLGHASLRWDGSKVIYFDPYQLQVNSPKADIVLVTHEHFDHCSTEDIKIISSSDTIIITNKAAAGKIRSAGIISKQIESFSPGEEIKIGDVRVKAVASYNTNKHYHLPKAANLGFIVYIDNISLYHAGDTDFIPEMKDVRCDIALLPVPGTYMMTAEEASSAALLIKPKIAVPIHYGKITGKDADAGRFADLLKGKIEVKILKRESSDG